MKTTTPYRSALSRRFVSAAAMMIATALNIMAAEADKDPQVPADLHPVELPEVVVTARRVEEHPLDVPAYTNVITREQINQSGASNLIELLKSQANLSFTSLSSSPTNTKVSMRGTGTDGNGRTLILIDGIRANRPDMGDFNWLQFAVQDIESIEVIQGPQGGYYGDNAVGGVIKINTRRVPETSSGQVSALVGSNATVKISGGYTQTFGKAWASVSGGHDESDGYREHSGYNSDSGAATIGYDNKKNSVTQLSFSYVDTDYEQPTALTLAQYEADPTQSGSLYTDGWSKLYRISGSNKFGEKDGSQIITDAAFYATDEYTNLRAFSTTYDRSIDGGSFSPKAVVEFEGGTITPGVDINYDKLEVAASSPAIGSIKRFVVGPYLGGDWNATDALSLSAVARHQFNTLEASGTNIFPIVESATTHDQGDAYQVAANYRPVKTTRVYAKYDHTYRFPATDEIAYYQGFFAPVFFNPNLQPEVSDNVELGADYNKGFWVLGAAAYHMNTKDEIAYNGATSLNENIARTERKGVQAHVVYDRCLVGFRARADFISAEVVENDDPFGQQSGQLPLVPKWQTTETVFCRPFAGCMAEFTHRYVGSSSSNPIGFGEVPAANLFDLKIAYAINVNWAAYTGVNNIADTKSISANYYGSIYPNEGRFIYIGSNYKF